MDSLIFQYISESLNNFFNQNTCCVYWFGPFCSLEYSFNPIIQYFGIHSKTCFINGRKVIKIYKTTCKHNIHLSGNFKLTEKSQKDILQFLSHTGNRSQHVPLLFKNTRERPSIPPNRFTIVPPRETVIYQPSNLVNKQVVQESWRIYPFKDEILHKISTNRILVINGDNSLEKSTAIPMFVVDDSIEKGEYCKIMCVESDNLTAITHCTVLTSQLKERIGSRVGFQVYLQSRVCDNTNIIYTTAVFFLRVLMGQHARDSFRNISHIMVADAHLHNAYTDIFLHELKKVLPHYPHIKIIFFSNSCYDAGNSRLLNYFKEGDRMDVTLDLQKVVLVYLEEINLIVDSNQLITTKTEDATMTCSKNKEWADIMLGEYEDTGTDIAFNRLLCFIYGNMSINYAHSKTGCTALIAAAKHKNFLHLAHLLICEDANPFLKDNLHLTALDYAIQSTECIRILMDFMQGNIYAYKPKPIDFDILKKLVHLLTTNWTIGNILIFLPSYEDLLKLSYEILKMQFVGQIPQDLTVYLLHQDIQYDELQPIIAGSLQVKIILTTKLAESVSYLNDITYVIDCCIDCLEKYDPKSKCKSFINELASQESLQRRSAIASRFTAGHCFRLIPRTILNKLPLQSTPELLYMPINRISLTAKHLCAEMTLAKYFEQMIVSPPSVHVLHCVEFLKKIEVLDCTEEITWLGCRLIDVPIDLELGKCLVMSIMLKCLDPVLTVVSFLTCTNTSELERCFKHKNIIELPFADGNTYSDHLTLLRLYEFWQNDQRQNSLNDNLSDQQTYVINGILDKVCGIRTHLVGALRSSQLIHNQGPLSMHSINIKAYNWAIVKAALASGLYPKICIIDRSDCHVQSKSQKLYIHPSSTLLGTKNSVVYPLNEKYPSDWIVFFGETNSFMMNSISNCTLVSPVTVALFAGKTDLDLENIDNVTDTSTFVYIDEWIWLNTDFTSAILLYKFRQRFYTTYLDFVQTCGSSEKWRRANIFSDSQSLLNVLSKILLEEDMSSGFEQPMRVGNRPKAVTTKFTTDFNVDVHFKPLTLEKLSDCRQNCCLKKEFFLINISNSNGNIWKQSMIDLSKEPISTEICASVSDEKLTYVIVFSQFQQLFTNVGLVKSNQFILRNCFRISMPLSRVINACEDLKLKLNIPSLCSSWNCLKLDNDIGEIILNLL